MRGKPNIELLEPRLESRLEVTKEAAILRSVLRIDEYPVELIPKLNAALVPDALDDL